MESPGPRIDPNDNDPARWAHSLLHHAEILIPCLDAAQARSVVEIGAYAGDLTGVLVRWAEERDARVWAIDPSPQDRLVDLAERSSQLELVRETSLDALPRIPPTDAVIIDGDHNYYTVSEELRLIAEPASGRLPLLVFHDVSWPHGRRDAYFAPERIPEEHRQPLSEGAGLFPGEPGLKFGGLTYKWAAAREGGARNGVLTAVEDFAAQHPELRLAIVPVFFGLGVLWPRDAPWADAVEEVLRPWDRNPLLERLEANRVLHLAAAHFHSVHLGLVEGRRQRQEALLRRFLESSAFSVAERLSSLRQRAGVGTDHAVISKEEIRRVLAD